MMEGPAAGCVMLFFLSAWRKADKQADVSSLSDSSRCGGGLGKPHASAFLILVNMSVDLSFQRVVNIGLIRPKTSVLRQV